MTAPVGHEESAGCPKRGQDEAFREKLLHEAAAPRADREPHRSSHAAGERLDQQEIPDVGAGDEQDKNDHGEHDF